MTIVAQHLETINLPDDVSAYRAFVRNLDDATRLLLFGVPRDSVTFRCPTNGRIYADETPVVQDSAIWTRCYWCDTQGRVRGRDKDFDRASPQPHPNPIVENDDAASQTFGC